ncbi:MAG TPA: transcription termination/antitermination NusG family protein [Chitinispirillaceae bacterium]|nr:transcription termination/antitermination NusG family protein [Chitinispirillaceae bacterium]
MVTPNDAPPIRYPDRPLCEALERWWIAKVKPRQEKQLAIDLRERNVEYFLPLIVKNTPRPGTKSSRLFTVPLFPGYLCFAQNAPKDIFSTGRVVNLMEVRNQSRFIRECDQILRVIQGQVPIVPLEEYVEGMPVMVEYGPLKGLEGIITEVRGNSRLVLSVEGLGRACVTIDNAWVRRKDNPEESD